MPEPSESFVGSLTLFLPRDFLLLFVALVVDFFVGCFFFRGGTIVRVTSVERQSSRAKIFRLTYYLIYHKYIINKLYLSNKNLAPVNQRRERCDSRVESPPEEIQ